MKKICSLTGKEFEVTDADLQFYDRISPVFAGTKFTVPPPTICPEARYQRRLAFRNERNLYHRKCDLSGRSMISMHPVDSVFPVYHITQWLSDSWDPKDYAEDVDLTRPFFDQFKEFCDRIPHFSAFVDPHMDQNSEYTNCSSEAKNCYMISQAERNEDCYFSRGINNCKSCCDCYRVHKCELCYEVIDGNNCYNCMFCEDIDNSSDCFFSTDLRGCKHCFGCHGLINKEYYIFNKPVSKQQWQEQVEALELTNSVIAQMCTQSRQARLAFPQRATRTIQCEDCIGDHITNCRNSNYIFDSNNLEHCTYCNEIANDAKYCMDYCMWGINCELLYECNGCGYNVYNTMFSNHCWQNVSNLLYCESCFPSVKDCFGCFGLRNAQYCIFNKQYSKEEYETTVAKLITHMQTTGEWGEFFPIHISPYSYNESLAQQFFPMTKSEVETNGWNWYQQANEKEQYLGPQRAVPNRMQDLTDDVCSSIFRCKETNKPYKIIAQELDFYKKVGLPLPELCPQARHINRHERRNPRQLWTRNCAKTGEEILSTFAPDRSEVVYSEQAYLDYIS